MPIVVFHGELSPPLARIYARMVPDADDGAPWTLGGWIEGPYCVSRRTLPARVALVDQGVGPSLLAEAAMPDPCFWTAEVPYVYQARVEVRQGADVASVRQQLLGLRRLGVVRRQLILEGRPWRLRAAERWSDEPGISAHRERGLGVVVRDCEDAVLREASEQGAWVVGWAGGEPQRLVEQLEQFSRWPAVAVVVVEPLEGEMPAALKQHAPNVLLAELHVEPQRRAPADWADLLACPLSQVGPFCESADRPILPLARETGEPAVARWDAEATGRGVVGWLAVAAQRGTDV